MKYSFKIRKNRIRIKIFFKIRIDIALSVWIRIRIDIVFRTTAQP